MFHFLFLNLFIYLISAMKNINITHDITGRIDGFHDSHLPLLKFAQWFMTLAQDLWDLCSLILLGYVEKNPETDT